MVALAMLLLSALLQVVAAVLSFRLIRITGRMTAWIILSSVMAFQALRRILTFSAVLTGSAQAKPLDDGIGLLISLGMVLTVLLIQDYFEAAAQGETRFRTVADFTSDMELWVGPEGDWRYVSPSCERLTGLPTTAFLADATRFESLIHPEDQARYRAHWEERRKPSGGSLNPGDLEFRILRPDGELRWIGQVSQPVRDSKGSFHGWRISNRDITDRKQMEAERADLEIQNHQLQKAESLGRMAGAIAHHFNNKLQAAMTNLELLGALPKGADPARFLAMARQALERAAEVSRLMLLYLGQSSRDREPLELAELCRHSLELLRATLPPGLRVAAELPEGGPWTKGHAGQLHQVLNNLITNAWEAQKDGDREIQLRLLTLDAHAIPDAHRVPLAWEPADECYACLEVRDSGQGIAAADLEKIFDPFYSTRFVGRGLGLSVALGIVQAHGGGISVESQEGMGSCFRVYLPLSAALPAKETAPAELPDRLEAHGTILLVDDDEAVRSSTAALLEHLGFQPLVAQGGAEALALFDAHPGPIRAVLTDLSMPGLDGWATLAALRQRAPSLPAILASGYDREQLMAEDHAEQPQAYLNKPFDLLRLQAALAQALK